MAIEDVGVRLVVENEAKFKAAMNDANKAVESFGNTAKGAASGNLSKLGKALDGAKGKLNSFVSVATSPQGMQVAAGMAGSLAAAVVGVGYALKKTVDEYVAYNEQVRLFSAATGTAPDQLSRLMQAADDMGVSMGSVQTALQMLSRHGITPTIENVAQLSDRLLAIEDPAERSAQAAKLFGRGWASISAFVLAGGDAIRKGTAAVESSLVVTNKSIEQSRKYAIQIDQLADSWTALRYQAAEIILPVAIEGLEKVNKEIPQLLSDVMNVYHLFGTLQKGMEQGAISGMDAAKAIGQYLAAEKTAPQVIADTNLAIAEQHNAVKEQQTDWNDLSNILGANTTALSQTANGFKLLEGSTAQATTGLQNTATAAQTSQSAISKEADALRTAGQSAQYFKQQTDKLLEQKQLNFKASLEFSMPDVAAQMKNVMDQIDWKAAGGQALQDFINGMGAKGQEINKQLAANIGAVDVAIKVQTGDLTQQEGINQIKELFKEVGGIDTTQAKTFIDSIGKMSPPDLSSFLSSLQAMGGATGKDAAKAASDLAEQIATAGSNANTYGQMYSAWSQTTADLSKNSGDAAKNQEQLGLKITATQTAIGLAQSDLSTWKDNTYGLSENAREAAAQVGALNTAIKSLPESKTIDIYVNQHGVTSGAGGGGGGNSSMLAGGGSTFSNNVYWVGEKGPEPFISSRPGYILSHTEAMGIFKRYAMNTAMMTPRASGGKIGEGSRGSTWEKVHNKAVKERKKKQKQASGGGGSEEGTGKDKGELPTIDDQLEQITSANEFAWNLLRQSVAEYNILIKSGARPEVLAAKKAQIDQLGKQAEELTRIKQELETKKALISTRSEPGEYLPSGIAETIPWLQSLINKFGGLFDLLNSGKANKAMEAIAPLISNSPAPLAVGLKQIKSEMAKLDIGGFFSNVSQVAKPNYYTNTSSNVYNINVPVTASVGNQADISRLAYAVAKEIAANVRS